MTERSTYAPTFATQAALYALTAAEWAMRAAIGPDRELAREIVIENARKAARFARMALQEEERIRNQEEETWEHMLFNLKPAG